MVMLEYEVEEILREHVQKFQGSSVASALEMVLKLEGDADEHYFELQKEQPNGFDYDRFLKTHLFGHIGELRFNSGVRFSQSMCAARNGKPFDFKAFSRLMHRELGKGHYVVLAIFSNEKSGAEDCHGYLVYGQDQTKYYYVTAAENNGKIVTGNWTIPQLRGEMESSNNRKGADVYTHFRR